MPFRRRLSLALMAADFVTLGQTYEVVLVILGIDEHKYVRFAQDVAMRFDQQTPIRSDFTLAAFYARLNTGFGGHPKFSKSSPRSGISVEDSPDDIKNLVMTDDAAGSESSPVHQLMYQMAYSSHGDLLKNYIDCENRTPAWTKEKKYSLTT